MSAHKVTPEELAHRRKNVISILARNPDLPISHFKHAWGYEWGWLKSLRDEGIVFGVARNKKKGIT